MTKFASSIFAILLLVSVFLPTNSVHAAFGISPPFIIADKLVPGARYTQIVYLVQDQPEQDLPIKATLDISDTIRSWVTIDHGFDFVIPKGVRQFPVEIQITVPKDAPLSKYSGSISFVSKPSQSGQVTIALGAQVSLSIVVGDEIYEKVSIPLVRLLDIEEGWDPRVYVKFNNEGNVAAGFESATYELLDQYGATRLAYIQKNDGFPEVAPFTIQETTYEFPVTFKLGLGQYWGNVIFYREGQPIATQKTVFNVLKQGSLSSPTAQLLNFIKDNPFAAGGAGAVALGIIGFFVIRRFRKAGNS